MGNVHVRTSASAGIGSLVTAVVGSCKRPNVGALHGQCTLNQRAMFPASYTESLIMSVVVCFCRVECFCFVVRFAVKNTKGEIKLWLCATTVRYIKSSRTLCGTQGLTSHSVVKVRRRFTVTHTEWKRVYSYDF